MRGHDLSYTVGHSCTSVSQSDQIVSTCQHSGPSSFTMIMPHVRAGSMSNALTDDLESDTDLVSCG